MRRTEPLDDRAEGDCNGVPYTTELVNCDGCSIHFWMGDNASEEGARELLKVAKRDRDIVRASYSSGQPSSYWAHQDMGRKP